MVADILRQVLSISMSATQPSLKQLIVAAVNKTLKTEAMQWGYLVDLQWSPLGKFVHVKNKARFAFAMRFANMIGFDKKVLIARKTEAPLPTYFAAGFHTPVQKLSYHILEWL